MKRRHLVTLLAAVFAFVGMMQFILFSDDHI